MYCVWIVDVDVGDDIFDADDVGVGFDGREGFDGGA